MSMQLRRGEFFRWWAFGLRQVYIAGIAGRADAMQRRQHRVRRPADRGARAGWDRCGVPGGREFPWLTVRRNIAFGLRSRLESARDRGAYQQALSFTGLTGFADAYPSQLSGGMRQRVCIARTLVLQPRLILLDEPFGALDEQTRLLMGDEVLRLWRETGATVLLITHSLDEATMLSGRVGVMSARPGGSSISSRPLAARSRQPDRQRAGIRRDHRAAVGTVARRMDQGDAGG